MCWTEHKPMLLKWDHRVLGPRIIYFDVLNIKQMLLKWGSGCCGSQNMKTDERSVFPVDVDMSRCSE